MERIVAVSLVLAACHSARSSGPPSPVVGSASASNATPPVQAPGSAVPGLDATASPVPWARAFDLDGDGLNDTIGNEFSGGAHCCYRIKVTLTLTGATIELPFELDGGYVGGLDLSQPDQLDVRRIDAPLPEIMMKIQTYNGQPQPIPKEWKQRYGFSTHHIAVGFPDGKLRVRDVPSVSKKRR